MDRDSQPAGSVRTIPRFPRARLGGGESRRRRRRKGHPSAGGRRSRHPAVSSQPRRSACPFSLWRSTGRRRRMTIENREVKSGTRLVARYKGQEHTANVVETDAGIRYRLADGKEYKSPSAAGSAIMGGNACNGGIWWLNGPASSLDKATNRAGRRHLRTANTAAFTHQITLKRWPRHVGWVASGAAASAPCPWPTTSTVSARSSSFGAWWRL